MSTLWSSKKIFLNEVILAVIIASHITRIGNLSPLFLYFPLSVFFFFSPLGNLVIWYLLIHKLNCLTVFWKHPQSDIPIHSFIFQVYPLYHRFIFYSLYINSHFFILNISISFLNAFELVFYWQYPSIISLCLTHILDSRSTC